MISGRKDAEMPIYPAREPGNAIRVVESLKLVAGAALMCLLGQDAFGQGATLAVVEKVSGSVGFYSAAGERLADVSVSTHPHEIVLSPDKRLLYVTDNGVLWMTNAGEGGNTISIIDVASRRKTGAIDLGNYRRPHGIDIDAKSGRLLVTVENPDGLLLIDPVNRKILRKYDVRGKSPHMVLFGPTGQRAFVSNSGSGTLAVIELQTGDVQLVPTGANPQGGVFSSDGRTLYLTNSEDNSISIIDVLQTKRTGVIATGKQPVRIALTPDGKTLVYGLQAGQAVGFADIAARRETAQVALGGTVLSLTMSEDGRIAYAGVQDQDKIFVVSVPGRKIVRVIRTPKGAGPDPVLPLP
jgi:YVTN family beta-propeller protein